MVSMSNTTTGSTHYHSTTKRKNEDDPSSSLNFIDTSHSTNIIHSSGNSTYYHRPNTTTVVYSPRNANSWTQCKNRLHTLLLQYNDVTGTNGANSSNTSDPVMDDIATISTQTMKRTVLDVPQSSKLQKADEIILTMESDIQHITQQVQNVSTIVSSLQAQYDKLQMYYTTMQNEMETLQLQQQLHQNQIQKYQSIIEKCEYDIGTTKQSMYKTVPRLQQNISLYVSMTGIKWKYDNNNNDDDINGHEDEKLALRGEIVSSKMMFTFEVIF